MKYVKSATKKNTEKRKKISPLHVLLFPVAVITFYWWGYKYFKSVIN